MITKNINIAQLHDALLYLKMNQLKQVCEQLELDPKGVKLVLIERITTFIQSGKKLKAPVMLAQSKAKRGINYPLAANTRMLFGAYKNDLATRNFFKKLVGEHFHFTAYGIDWLNERWMAGNPPTYAEFAEFWQAEHLARKVSKPQPKEEWAYINFVQEYLRQDPAASKDEVLNAWKAKQEEMVAVVMHMLGLD